MADLTIASTSVLSQGSADIVNGRAAATIAAGDAVYRATDGRFALADNDAVDAAHADMVGIALNGAATNQPLAVQLGGDIIIGATIEAGTAYYLSSTPGKICPREDLAGGDRVIQIGLGKSTTVLNIRLNKPGVTLA